MVLRVVLRVVQSVVLSVVLIVVAGAKEKKRKDIIEENKTRKLNKSEKKQSIASLISEKTKNKNLLVLNDFNNQIKKTKEMSLILKKFEITNSLIILDKSSKDKVEKSIRNIPNVKVTDINHFSAFDMIKFKKIVFTESSVKELEKRYA